MKQGTFFRHLFRCRAAVLLGLVAAWAAVCPGYLSSPSAGAATALSGGLGAQDKADGEAMMAAGSQLSAQVNAPEDHPLSLTDKQRHHLLKDNFKNMKRDAGDLFNLAKALQDELDKSNENVLSLDVVDKADKIEKLAKRIKGTARGY